MTRHDDYGFPVFDPLAGESVLAKADFIRGGFGVRFLSPNGTLFLTELRLVWLPVTTGVLTVALRSQEPLEVWLRSVERSYQRRSIRWFFWRALVVDFKSGETARFYPLHASTNVVQWASAIQDIAQEQR